jgi:hypothetical protein
MTRVALVEQKRRQIDAALAGDAGDDYNFHTPQASLKIDSFTFEYHRPTPHLIKYCKDVLTNDAEK